MARKIAFAFVLVAVVSALAAPLASAVPATLILTSGDRVRGNLVDMGRDFTMLVGGDEQHFAVADVAVIDFVGGGDGITTDETSKMQGGRALIVQRSGDFYYGRLYDITGRDPLRLIFNTEDGEREMGSNEIRRIFFRRWDGMPAAPVAQPPANTPVNTPVVTPTTPTGIGVSAARVWIDTGVQITSGQMVAFNATGEIVLSGDPSDVAGPAGAHSGRQAGRGAPLPGVAAGALVGKIGVGSVFAIGNQTQALPMSGSGRLFLAVNDETPTDNLGEFRVQITIVR